MINPITPNKREYSALLKGDYSVGLFPCTIEVQVNIFDDQMDETDLAAFDEAMKKLLLDFYSVQDDCEVHTKQEIDEMIRQYELEREETR